MVLTKFFLFILTFIFSFLLIVAKSEACEVSMPHTLAISKDVRSIHIKSVIDSNSCQESQLDALSQYILNQRGPIGPLKLKHHFPQIRLQSPKIVIIKDLEDYLREKVALKEGKVFTSAKVVGENPLIFEKKDNSFLADCNCENAGEVNIKLSAFDSQSNTIWVNAKVLYKVKVLTSRSHIRANSTLRKSQFDFKWIETVTPEQYVTSLENISFFKTNSALHKGKHLLHQQIRPIQLVRVGETTKVFLNEGNMRISLEAQARQSGGLGQIIELYNKNGKKTFTGRISGHNTVTIDL